MSSTKEEAVLVVEIPMDEGDPLGATPDQQLVIIQIQSDTLADGRLQVGDKVLTVNDREPTDVRHFYHLLNVAAHERNNVRLRIRRDTNKAKELDAHNQIPANRARFIQRREGFLYKLVSIAYQKRVKLGLSIKQRQNHVLVSSIKPDTLSARVFEVMDQILDVDSIPVTDTTVAESVIREGFKKRQYFTAVIARPTSAEARRQVAEELARPSRVNQEPETPEEPSVKMARDVRAICQHEIERLNNAQAHQNEGANIIVEPGTRHPNQPVIDSRPKERRIASDIQDMSALKHIGPIHSLPKE